MIRSAFKILFALFFLSLSGMAQTPKEKWVDSVFRTLSTNEKIGQLFMIQVSSHSDADILDLVERRVKSGLIGGINWTNGTLLGQAEQINLFQQHSEIPLLMAQDGSRGLGALLTDGPAFPSPLVQGAAFNDSLIYHAAREVGRQMKKMGLHMSFSPAANLPVPDRSIADVYAEHGFSVANKTVMHMKGLQAEGILACGRYYPLFPRYVFDRKGRSALQLAKDSLTAYPFDVLIREGLNAIMPTTTGLPAFYEEKKSDQKKKFSELTLAGFDNGTLLPDALGFKGLIVVDIQGMEARDKFEDGEAEIFAFRTGAHVILTSSNLSVIARKMRRLIRKEKGFAALLDKRIRTLLEFKFDAGLDRVPRVETDLIFAEINTPETRILERKIYEQAVTVLRDEPNHLPLASLESKKFAVLTTGDSIASRQFHKQVNRYVFADSFPATDTISWADHDEVLVPVFPSTEEPVIKSLLEIARKRGSRRPLIMVDFGSAAFKVYAGKFPVVLTGYTDDPQMISIVAQVIFGALPATGVLPVRFGELPSGTNHPKVELQRLSYSFAEDAGMDSNTLQQIETIALEAINAKATPGCHVLVARKGKVVYDRSFGHLSYDQQSAVTEETIYDLASVTKVAATLQAVMFMYEKGLIDINKKASVYLPELRKSNKKDFTLKDILTHQAGLWPFLPFWAQTMKDSLHLPEYYSSAASPQYPFQVADNLYSALTMKDSLWNWIIKARIRDKPHRTPYDYRYSDMGFYILQHLAEVRLNQPMEDFLYQNLYEPLGAHTMGFLPLSRFPKSIIAPTEDDRLFRKKLLIGTVHDQGAAMHGGTAGHAGLFSNANDLAKFGQMLLQEGHYGGMRYFKPETVRYFAQKTYASSHRGLGWNKPIVSDWNSPTSLYASEETYGHTGFTGTCIWIDPVFDLVYIFLSNRVHPDMNNSKLLSANIRSRIQDVVYQSIFNYCKASVPPPVQTLSAR